MSGILVPSKTAALLGQAQAIFEGKAIRRTRRIPQFLPDGTEVKTVEQVAAMMRVDSITAALYVNEQKSSVPFRLGVEAKSVLLQYGGYEVKDIVRSAAGVRKYGQPIGSIIIADVTLPNLKVVDEPYEGWLTVQGDSGETYEVGLDEDATGKWVACRLPGGWDDVVIEGGKNRDDVLKKLSKHDLADMPKAPKLSKREENDIAWFNDKERGIYDQARLDGDDHEEALNTAQWEGLTNSQSNAIRNLDTIVRDWYWDLRADEADHATALRKVKALDKVMNADDFDSRKYYAAKKKNGAVSAADDAIAGEFTPSAPNGRRPTSQKPSKPRRGDSSAFRDPNPPRGGARAAQARTVANQTGGKKPVQRGTFHHGPNSATSSNAGARARKIVGGGSPKGGSGASPEVTKTSLDAAKPGDKVTVAVPGEGGVNHHIFTRGVDDRWHKGTADTKGSTSAEVLRAFSKVQKDKGATIRFGDAPGPFDYGQTLPGGTRTLGKPSREERMAARNAQNAKDWPVGTQVTVTVHSLGGREEEVSGTVSGHSSGGVTVQTTSGHGDLSVEPSKLRKVENGWEEHLRTHMGLGTNDVVPKYQLGLRQQDQWRAMTNEQRTLANEWMRTTTASQAITRAKRGERSDAQTGTWERNAPKGKVTLKRTRKSGALEIEMDGEKYTFIPGDGWGSGWRRGWSEDGPTIGLSEATILERLNAWKKKS